MASRTPGTRSLPAVARQAAAAVREDRLWRRLMTMAEIGARPDGGVNRQALSDEDIRARALLIEWARARQYRVSVDDIANLFLTRPGRNRDAAPVVAGSHMDSQPAGGRFDGIYGVLAAVEVLEALDDAGIQTEHPLEVVAWTNEEGGRFTPGCMGSAVFVGELALADVVGIRDQAGICLGEALERTLAATPGAARRQFDYPLAAYLEPHIEQGPVLEAEGLPVGIVTGVQGARHFMVEVEGAFGHAGTTPHKGRKDALRAAVDMIGALQALMDDPDDRVRFTVGRLDVDPNAPNTIAGRAAFSIDFRHPDQAVLTRLGDAIEATCRAAAGPCALTITPTMERAPSVFPAAITDALERAALGLDLGHRRLPSGAFHDAKFLSDVCPTGMLFVPCAGGLSHHPAESATPADLAAGTRVLAATMVDLAGA